MPRTCWNSDEKLDMATSMPMHAMRRHRTRCKQCEREENSTYKSRLLHGNLPANEGADLPYRHFDQLLRLKFERKDFPPDSYG